ncbi:hypothetical protein M9Y10_016686 [Tritrichomonas musculus]|uniref:Protein kinase domain-containing protein n=1 Tax=Tritrichomonas musculus TaxID=1915356 RepID=A0ABR2HX77_9EUKA
MRPSFDEIVDILTSNFEFIECIDYDDFLTYSESIGEKIIMKYPIKPKEKVKVIQKAVILDSAEKISELTIDNFSRIIETEISNNSIKDYTLNLDKYEQKELIRKNEFSKTFKVIEKDTNNIYAAKISNIDISQFSNEQMLNIAIEFNSISQLNHPSILRFVGFSPRSYKNEAKPVVVTEIYPERTLDDILKMERKNITISGWNATKRLINIYGIASAMKYLHDYEIVHRNLIPNNIFLDKSFYPKLYNFGLCTHLLIVNSMTMQTASKIEGSPIYSAPEFLETQQHTKESDVYSFAVILYEMITREKPLSEINYFNFVSEVVEKNRRPKFNKSIQDCYKNLIEICWSHDPSERPSFEEIVDYIKNDPQFITPDVDKKEFMEYVEKLSTII